MKNKKFYITTSIPYANSVPHIGFALEIIQADVLARYQRQLGKDVFFLTGTDEHGLKTKKAAEKAGKTPEDFTSEISQKFKNLKEALNISNDDFIRTTDQERHWPSVKSVWEQLKANDDFYKQKYAGFYCAGCEAFKTEKELVNNKCPLHQTTVELIKEENYFFKLSKYLPQIKKLLKAEKIKIIPASKKTEVLSMLNQGLQDLSFSRVKEKYWGFPVPWDNSQVIYVWGDALINYISALDFANTSPLFKKYWPADVHCIGKDIVKFHAIYWPAILLSLKLPLPKTIFVHGFVTVNGQKMSKSLGNVVDPFELAKKYGSASSPQVGTDAVRYYFLREFASTEDGDFTFEKFEARYNADLAGGIGNLLARTIAMTEKIKNQKLKIKMTNQKLKREIKNTEKDYKKHLEEFKFNEALAEIWQLITTCDKHINENKPWEQRKDSPQVVSDVLFTLSKIADFLLPFLPETAEKITSALKNKKSIILFPRLK